MTQEQLGEGLAPDGRDVGKGGISSWEVDRTAPSASQIAKLCRRLGCSADELLGLDAAKPAQESSHEPAARPAAAGFGSPTG